MSSPAELRKRSVAPGRPRAGAISRSAAGRPRCASISRRGSSTRCMSRSRRSCSAAVRRSLLGWTCRGWAMRAPSMWRRRPRRTSYSREKLKGSPSSIRACSEGSALGDRMSPMIIGLLLLLQLGTPPVYDRVILSGRVMDPASRLDAVRNIGLTGGRIAVITTHAIRGRDTIDARGLVVAPGFIDLHAHGQTPETYRFYSLDGVTTALELELGTSDVAAWYRERSAGERVNYGVSIGHIKVRMAVMHDSGTWMP